MKLFHNPASPFVRKVMVCAYELGVVDRLELVTTSTTPLEPNPALVATTGYAKIPTLITDDGTILFDSRVICEYVDTLTDEASMFPTSGPARWTALRMQAQGDGLCDTAVGVRYETFLRPEERRWDTWIVAQKDRLHRSTRQIEEMFMDDIDGVHIGSIAIACALGYLDFRFPDLGWREGRPKLAAWYEVFAARRSMILTVPKAI